MRPLHGARKRHARRTVCTGAVWRCRNDRLFFCDQRVIPSRRWKAITTAASSGRRNFVVTVTPSRSFTPSSKTAACFRVRVLTQMGAGLFFDKFQRGMQSCMPCVNIERARYASRDGIRLRPHHGRRKCRMHVGRLPLAVRPPVVETGTQVRPSTPMPVRSLERCRQACAAGEASTSMFMRCMSIFYRAGFRRLRCIANQNAPILAALVAHALVASISS